MSITRSQTKQVAALAKLALSEGELDELTRDLGSILDHMHELAEVDSPDLPAMGGVSDHPAPFRADAPGADPLQRSVESFAPAWEERLFVVPRLAALGGDALAEEGPHS